MPDTQQQISAIRAFNRFYTKIIGLLDDGVLNSAHNLAEARLIHEIGKNQPVAGVTIAGQLQMDKGQMSRLLSRLSEAGLVTMTPDASDKRVNLLSLTPDGKKTFKKLDQLSDAAISGLIEPLDGLARQNLVESMERIEAALAGAQTEAPLKLRPPNIGDIGWLIHRQAVLYNHEYGWNADFEALITKIYGDYAALPDSEAKALWVADLAGAIAGSVYVVPAEKKDTAQLRMLYVEPAARGRGVGAALVNEAINFARSAGYQWMFLWTQDCLVSARRIYQAAGFELVREGKHHSFGKHLNGQFWEIKL